jgi:hypothetical protein
MNHGTRRAHDDHGCRCVPWNARQRAERVRRAAGKPEDNVALNHGTKSAYVNPRLPVRGV